MAHKLTGKFAVHKTFSPRHLILKKAIKIARLVELLEAKYRKMTNQELSAQTEKFLSQIEKGSSLDDVMVEALATAKEAIARVHGLRAFFVQIVGALIIHFGDFAEMYTGEGKTLTIVLASYLNALSKKGVHIVTVNEYLVKRDAEFCAQALNPLHITVGYNISNMPAQIKRKMFAHDITYTTNSELGFDYLRDNMVKRMEDKVIRTLSFAIVDEADSILIDEARTPLIISGMPKTDVSRYVAVDDFAKTLNANDYKIDKESNTITLTSEGVDKAEAYFKVKALFEIEQSDLYHKIKNALHAHFVFAKGVEYIVRDGKIMLVDHFTGRVLEGRSYNAGLHQAIQAKERVEIEPENVTVATITYQSFFRLYKKLSGVSGTALTEYEEFLKIYNMVVVPIPTNKKVIRKDLPDFIFDNKHSKWRHVAEEIERINKTGQAILVGTGSVEDSEELAVILRNKGLKFELLNAKNHAREADIVAQGGKKGSITIATNMAGRGTDIKIDKTVRNLGGLYVIGTEHHESRRVDNQLRGRSGRQGDPGVTRFFVSLDDVLFQRFGAEKSDKATEKIEDDSYFDSIFFSRMIKGMQKKVEGLSFDVRKNLIDYDIVLSNQRELVYKQRDQVISNSKNVETLKKMMNTVAHDIVEQHRDRKDPNIVNSSGLVDQINKKLIFVDLLKPNAFVAMEVKDVSKKVSSLINLAIDTRQKLLPEDYFKNVCRDVILQNLDLQWTKHLDVINKVREGVMLRSLEQRSPLNIYVEDADKLFLLMKKNVAHASVAAINRMFIVNAHQELRKALIDNNIFKEKHLNEINTIKSSAPVFTIGGNNGKGLNINLGTGPKSPKDMLLTDAQKDATKARLEAIKKAREEAIKRQAVNEKQANEAKARLEAIKKAREEALKKSQEAKKEASK